MRRLNDSIGLNDLVPTSLVFGMLPALSIERNVPASRRTRMKMLFMVKMKVEEISAEQKITTAFQSILPSSARYFYKISDRRSA